MKEILLIIALFSIVIYAEEMSTDTVQTSKKFMKSLITMDEKTIKEIKHPHAGSELSMKYFFTSEYKALKASNITIDELKYTVEKGKNGHTCVIVQSIGTRKTSYGLLPIHWRLGFEKAPSNESFLLLYLDSINEANGYNDNGCW